MLETFQIEERYIGPQAPCYVIAEAGVNHNGDLATALKLIDVAREAGADAVKFQTFRAGRLVSRSAPKAAYQMRSGHSGESQFDMLRRLELSEADHQTLFTHCKACGITFLSTPFDESSADMLEGLGVAAFKTGSGDLTNLPLIAHLAGKGKPLILSTGMGHQEEVEAAMEAFRSGGGRALALLHCVSCYPAPVEAVNLRVLDTWRERYGCPVGLSDHTRGIEVAIAAAAREARLLEKHFTLDRRADGPDHAASLEPLELKAMLYAIRNVERALGTGIKAPSPVEQDVAQVARKSVFAGRTIEAGECMAADMLVCRRPGTGLSPARLSSLIGRRARRRIEADEMIDEGMLDCFAGNHGGAS